MDDTEKRAYCSPGCRARKRYRARRNGHTLGPIVRDPVEREYHARAVRATWRADRLVDARIGRCLGCGKNAAHGARRTP